MKQNSNQTKIEIFITASDKGVELEVSSNIGELEGGNDNLLPQDMLRKAMSYKLLNGVTGLCQEVESVIRKGLNIDDISNEVH